MISCMHAFYSSSCTSYMFSIHLLYFLHVFYASSCTSYMFSIHLPVLPTCFLCIFLYCLHVFYSSSCTSYMFSMHLPVLPTCFLCIFMPACKCTPTPKQFLEIYPGTTEILLTIIIIIWL